MRLIDADELITAFPCGETVQTECVRATIKHMPTIEERKKGEWNTDKESPEYATCSVCGHCDWDCTESEYFNFCPNCGADMRGEERGVPK